MTYTKPDIALLSNAAQAIGTTISQKGGNSLEHVGCMVRPRHTTSMNKMTGPRLASGIFLRFRTQVLLARSSRFLLQTGAALT